MKKDIYFCSTYYHTLITVLKRINGYIPYETQVVITGYIPDGSSLAVKLAASGLFSDVLFYSKIYPRQALKDAIFNKQEFVNAVDREFPLQMTDYNDIYLFMDNTWMSCYLKDKHVGYHILEDGLDVFKYIDHSAFSYMVNDDSLKGRVKRALREDSRYYLDCQYVQSIEVNDKDGIVLRKDPRVEEFPRKQLFDNLTKANKDTLLRIFSDKGMSFKETNIAIIFTYPMAQDHLVSSEKEQLLIYQNLIGNYKDYTIYLKPHPRDATDYSALDVHVINKNFPSEIINFINSDNIQKYISIESHCVDVYPKEKVDYYPLKYFTDQKAPY